MSAYDFIEKRFSDPNIDLDDIIKLMEDYATESIKASLEKASEEVMIKLNTPKGGIKTFKLYENENGVIEVNKESITNESNIVLL